MRRVLALLPVLVALGTALGGGVASAGPADVRPGEERAVYRRSGTAIRTTASALGEPIATLASGTRVRVLEVNQPWLRVQASQGSGWLRARETVEPAALGANPRPPIAGSGGAAVSQRDLSAAGRQLSAPTERGYRATHPNLARAYPLVDAMEKATHELDPVRCITFLDGAVLGRQGQDYLRPGLVPPSRATRRGPSPGDVVGRIGGGILERFGPRGRGGDVARAALQSATQLFTQLGKRFTPEQEYYLGRAVAANAIARYGVDGNLRRRRYVRLVGDAIVRLTTRLPANHGGYHFEVLDTDEINGVSGPGGFVLLTRGAVESCRTEDELAALLAHELAHISAKHGENILRAGQEWNGILQGLTRIGGAATDDRLASQLVGFFGQVVTRMSSTAIDHGYGRQLEGASDLEATYLLTDVVYDHAAMRNWLLAVAARPDVHGGATHASPAARAQALEPILAGWGPFRDGGGVLDLRRARLEAALER